MSLVADQFAGIWRLVECRAWDEHGNSLLGPYGAHPFGQIMFGNGRMLSALCNGDTEAGQHHDRGFTSYGGPYSFDGSTLTTIVDVASDPQRIGSRQTRDVVITGEVMLLRPHLRPYNGVLQRRELVWERVWRPDADPA